MRYSKDFLEANHITEEDINLIQGIISESKIYQSGNIFFNQEGKVIKSYDDLINGTKRPNMDLLRKQFLKDFPQYETFKVVDVPLKSYELIPEKYEGFKKLEKNIEKEGKSKSSAEAIAAAIGMKKYGKKNFEKHAEEGKKFD